MLTDVVRWAFRKPDVEEWLVRIVQSIYTNAQSHLRANGTFSDDFLIYVGLHRGSALIPSVFIRVFKAYLEKLDQDISIRTAL